MTNIIALFIKRHNKFSPSLSLLSFLVTLGLSCSWHYAQASTTDAPPELKNLLTQIDTAASQGNVVGVLQFYSPDFTNGDGLNRDNLGKSLTVLWQRYPQLNYSTKLQSWKSEGNAIIAETVTNITGLPSSNTSNLSFNATITSRQRVIGAKIVQQDILTERTLLTSGKKPPQVEIRLPQQVKVGQKYNFDAIVQEPIGDEILLGAVIEEPIQPGKYIQPSPIALDALSSGGIFKIGTAPSTPTSQWISAVLIRGDGMTLITQRLQVIKR